MRRTTTKSTRRTKHAKRIRNTRRTVPLADTRVQALHSIGSQVLLGLFGPSVFLGSRRKSIRRRNENKELKLKKLGQAGQFWYILVFNWHPTVILVHRPQGWWDQWWVVTKARWKWRWRRRSWPLEFHWWNHGTRRESRELWHHSRNRGRGRWLKMAEAKWSFVGLKCPKLPQKPQRMRKSLCKWSAFLRVVSGCRGAWDWWGSCHSGWF